MKQKIIAEVVQGHRGRLQKDLARFLMLLKERELYGRYKNSKQKKDETIGKAVEIGIRRKVVEGKEYHQLKEAVRKEKEFLKMVDRVRKWLAPLAEGPFGREGVT